MRKKDYQKPTTKVVQLKQQCHILAGSLGATRDGYGTANTDTWGDEE
jgi:hypothetical protein